MHVIFGAGSSVNPMRDTREAAAPCAAYLSLHSGSRSGSKPTVPICHQALQRLLDVLRWRKTDACQLPLITCLSRRLALMHELPLVRHPPHHRPCFLISQRFCTLNSCDVSGEPSRMSGKPHRLLAIDNACPCFNVIRSIRNDVPSTSSASTSDYRSLNLHYQLP